MKLHASDHPLQVSTCQSYSEYLSVENPNSSTVQRLILELTILLCTRTHLEILSNFT
eukprot:c29547_g1_i1 orf=235-405(+)